jgi:hypothetical protein
LDFKEKDRRIRELSEKFQFKIFIDSNMIDRFLTEIISMELTTKWSSLTEFLYYFGDVAFRRKIDLFKIILKNNYPNIYKKYPSIFTTLGEIKKIRDRIAHDQLTYDTAEGLIIFSPMVVRYDKNYETNETKLSEKKIMSLMRMSEKCKERIRELRDLIGKASGRTIY